MTTYVRVLVSSNNHGHGIPADVGVNLDLHISVARIFGLESRRNRVDVLRVCRVREVDSLFSSLLDQGFNEEVCAVIAFVADHAGECILPFPGFLGVRIDALTGSGIHFVFCRHAAS